MKENRLGGVLIMAGYKGVGLVFVRSKLRGSPHGPAVLGALSAEARGTFEAATATGWVPIEHACEVFEKAAPLLFPHTPIPLRELGRSLAQDNLGGVYRHIIRWLSVPFLLKQTAVLWRVYHNAGHATVTFSERSAELTLHDYPDLPERFRECMCGWISGAIEVCGGTNARVLKVDGPPHLWRVTWR